MLFRLCLIAMISISAYSGCANEHFTTALHCYNSDDFTNAYLSFGILSGIAGCEHHGLLGVAASAAKLGNCAAASHYFQLSYLTSLPRSAPHKPLRPLLGCLRHMGINAQLTPSSDFAEMIASIAHFPNEVSPPLSLAPECNIATHLVPINASIYIIDSSNTYPSDVISLYYRLEAIGVKAVSLPCQKTYDTSLHILISPYNCPTTPTNYITWDISSTQTLPAAKAKWSSESLSLSSPLFPRYLAPSVVQLYCTSRLLDFSPIPNFYHIFSPAVDNSDDTASRRLQALFAYDQHMQTLKAGLVYPSTLDDFPYNSKDFSLTRFSEVIVYIAPRRADDTKNILLHHSVQNQMLQGKIIIIMTHAEDVEVSPLLAELYVNTGVVITNSLAETFQRLREMLYMPNVGQQSQEENLNHAMKKYREHLSSLQAELSGILTALEPKPHIEAETTYGTLPCRSPFCRYPCATCSITNACQEFIDTYTPPASLTCPHPSNNSHIITLHPIGFATAVEDIFPCVGKKLFAFSTVMPFNKSTYIYGMQDEYEYKRDMAHSMYGITMKKAGWDCQRHYEIIASSSVPYFTDLEEAPPLVMPFLPRALLKQAKQLADSALYYVNGKLLLDMPRFDEKEYGKLSCCLHAFGKKHLTSKRLAEYVLERANVSHATSVLYLLEKSGGYDYMAAALLHGLRQHLGAAVTDYPRTKVYYEVPPEIGAYDIIKEKFVHGMGFSWAHRVPNIEIDRSNLHERIQQHEWDVVIYGQIHRGAPYLPTVLKHYSNNEIIFIDGEDWGASAYSILDGYYAARTDNSWLPAQHGDWRKLFSLGQYFKRELDGCPV